MLNKDFIDMFGRKAVERYPRTKILPSLVICQAILESGWGSTDKAVRLKNYHGIKWYNDSICRPYAHVNCATWEEYKPGEITHINADFCKFDTIDQELDCYYAWLNRANPNYKALHGCTDAMKTFGYIDASPYATDTHYGEKLTRIYQTNPSIKAYDDEVLGIPVPKKVKMTRVQVGAFSKKYLAEDKVNRLKRDNIDAILVWEDNMWKVQAGLFENRDNAVRQLDRVKASGYDCCLKDVYVIK